MVCLPGRVPQDVEFQISWLTLVSAYELIKTRLHGLLSNGQGYLGILWIAARPKLGPDLITGNFTDRSDGAIVIAAFNHGKRFPSVH